MIIPLIKKILIIPCVAQSQRGLLHHFGLVICCFVFIFAPLSLAKAQENQNSSSANTITNNSDNQNELDKPVTNEPPETNSPASPQPSVQAAKDLTTNLIEPIKKPEPKSPNWFLPQSTANNYLPQINSLTQTSFAAAAKPWANGQDTWTLMPRKLINRNLHSQLEFEPYRFDSQLPYFALAADASIGAETTRKRTDLSRYHGFFVIDTYAEIEAMNTIAVNLNLAMFNPSASDGYRFSSQVLPGAALHLHRDLFDIAGKPLHIEFIAPDLDLVTIGTGLLIEEVPLEGFAIGLQRGDIEWRTTFAGRVFWADDDFINSTINIFNGAFGIGFSRWLTETESAALVYPLDETSLQNETTVLYKTAKAADYLSGFIKISPLPFMRLLGEYGAHLRSPLKSSRQAFMVRADLMPLSLNRINLHIGYQFRFYNKGFGPRKQLVTLSTAPNMPYRENAYVTNSFEYLGVTSNFRQWSHTVMGEAEVALFAHVTAFAYGEFWQRYLESRRDSKEPVLFIRRFGRAPGIASDFYYRAGFRIFPWPNLPNRLSVAITNKLVASGLTAQNPNSERFVNQTVLNFAVEVFL
ncbi:MAG: hypothetical protein JW841_13805 [Deltaproteobacteria bacterium]|nr:hypothetical protein [Deltaproteobacteria bacterium]